MAKERRKGLKRRGLMPESPSRRARALRARGFRKERELVRKLWDEGFACIRAPASGSKVKHSVQPDIVAARNGIVLVMEVKTRRDAKSVYIEKEQVDKVAEWAKRAGPNAIPLVAVYLGKGLGWRFATLDKLEATERGNYRLSLNEASRLPDVLALKALCDNVKRVTTFISDS